jgi:hypothetical protein
MFGPQAPPTLIARNWTSIMPRKIRPQYGIDPVQEVSAFSFTDEQRERLFNVLRSVKSNRDDIIAELIKCAGNYIWLRSQNQQKTTRAQQNAVLKELGRLARDLEARLRSLDTDTAWRLMVAPLALHTVDAIPDLADRLDDFAYTAEQALRSGHPKSGPRLQSHVDRAVVKLASLYEAFTGERFSHNPKQRTKYDGQPHSPAGRFIQTFFEIVDPEIRPQALSTAMAGVVKSRRHTRKAATG